MLINYIQIELCINVIEPKFEIPSYSKYWQVFIASVTCNIEMQN